MRGHRTFIDGESCSLDAIGDRLQVLLGFDPDAQADTFGPIAALLEVVLSDAELHGTGHHGDVLQAPFDFIPVHNLETKSVGVELDAALQVVAGDGGVEQFGVQCT